MKNILVNLQELFGEVQEISEGLLLIYDNCNIRGHTTVGEKFKHSWEERP